MFNFCVLFLFIWRARSIWICHLSSFGLPKLVIVKTSLHNSYFTSSETALYFTSISCHTLRDTFWFMFAFYYVFDTILKWILLNSIHINDDRFSWHRSHLWIWSQIYVTQGFIDVYVARIWNSPQLISSKCMCIVTFFFMSSYLQRIHVQLYLQITVRQAMFYYHL